MQRPVSDVIMGDARQSAIVIGLPCITAAGFCCACFRIAMATVPSCSVVVTTDHDDGRSHGRSHQGVQAAVSN
jgi:hypothetical protein